MGTYTWLPFKYTGTHNIMVKVVSVVDIYELELTDCFAEAFVGFPVLSELELSLNSIVDVSIALGGFTTLQVTYNLLSYYTLILIHVYTCVSHLSDVRPVV